MGVERLGRYTVLKHLASGGMADVLLARTDGIEGFERHVVVKRIRAEHAKDQRFIQMFLDEARVAASLHHANIVQVHDIGEARGEYFFAMEYLHGEDLRKILGVVSKAKTHMPLGYVCAIVSATAAGLHYAHERRSADKKPLNIVHRDVSPSNILVSFDGSVKVVDFGIAKAAMRQVETRSGSLKGKVSYMSPEQCKGEDIDRRSDVYALGVLLYELATTTRLFKGENDYLLMDAIVNGKVPLPRVRRPDLPNELSSIIMRALSVDPSRRYQSADELHVALDQFAQRAGLNTSQSALAGYMKKLFGEKPEPWLDVDVPRLRDADQPGQTWSDASEDAAAEQPAPPVVADPADKTKSGSKRGRKSGAAAAITPRETRTSMHMGWEHQTPVPDPPPRGRGKLIALATVPLLGLAGVLVWQLVRSEPDAAPPAPVAVAVVRPPVPTVEPIDVPPATSPAAVADPAAVAVPAAAAVPAAVPVPVPVAAAVPAAGAVRAAAPARHEPRSKVAHRSIARIAPAAPASAPAPAPAPAAAAPAPVAAPLPPAPKLAVAAPSPAGKLAVAAPPAQVEMVMAQLSQATVEMVASDHERQLGKCEASAGGVHGEVAVTFQIDASGRVVKSQLATSVKNPRLAGCILKAVVSWQFPKPPSGAARGVYSIDYQ